MVERCLVAQIPLIEDDVEVAHIRERLARLLIDRASFQDALDQVSLAATVRSGSASIQASLFDLIPTEVGDAAAELLERALQESEEFKSLALLYELRLDSLEDSGSRADTFQKLGEIRHHRLADPPGSFSCTLRNPRLATDRRRHS